jgi:hypothetical protein
MLMRFSLISLYICILNLCLINSTMLRSNRASVPSVVRSLYIKKKDKFRIQMYKEIKENLINISSSILSDRNACLHPPLKLEISHVQSSSALLYVVSATSAVHFHNLVR